MTGYIWNQNLNFIVKIIPKQRVFKKESELRFLVDMEPQKGQFLSSLVVLLYLKHKTERYFADMIY